MLDLAPAISINQPPTTPVLREDECVLHAMTHYVHHRFQEAGRISAFTHPIYRILRCKYRQAAENYIIGDVRKVDCLPHHAVTQYQASAPTWWNSQVNLNEASQLSLRYYYHVITGVRVTQEASCDTRVFHKGQGYIRCRNWKSKIAAYIIYTMAKGVTTVHRRDGSMKLVSYRTSHPVFFWCYIVPTALTMVVTMDNKEESNLNLPDILNCDIANWYRSTKKLILSKGIWSQAWVSIAMGSSNTHPHLGPKCTAGVHLTIAKILDMLSPAPIIPNLQRAMRFITPQENAVIDQDLDQHVRYMNRNSTGV
jgi:hypothetical protein